jgi:hypothetical protein
MSPSSTSKVEAFAAWEEQVLSARGVQAGRKALRIRHINGTEVCKERPYI